MVPRTPIAPLSLSTTSGESLGAASGSEDEPATDVRDVGEAAAIVEPPELERPSAVPELEQDKEESFGDSLLSSVPPDDTTTVVAVSNDGFVTPRRSVHAASRPSPLLDRSSGSVLFPAWLEEHGLVSSTHNRFDWSESGDEDEFPDLSDWKGTSHLQATGLDDMIGTAEANRALARNMRGVRRVLPDWTDNESSGDDMNKANGIQVRCRHRSINGRYKRPKRPSRAPSPFILHANGLRPDDVGEPSQTDAPEDATDSQIPYGLKGKWRADDGADTEDDSTQRAQVQIDEQVARVLQQRLREEDRLAERLQEVNGRLTERVRELESREHESRSKTVESAGLGGRFARASSKLPAQSSMKRALAGYPDDSAHLMDLANRLLIARLAIETFELTRKLVS
ncbi:hypothetical protein HWV62_14902 [Athelia sp. TMB]|nr:hypothetical protein HWV62_14902 [Athelia sp. TMB]